MTLAALAEHHLPPGGAEIADEETAGAERAMLRLRTATGLPRGSEAAHRFAAVFRWGAANGLLEQGDAALVLTRRGRLVAGELFERLVAHRPALKGVA